MAKAMAWQLVVTLGVLLAACAGKPTPYQAAQGGFGYSEQQIEENRYRVSFAGNSATSRPTIEDYLLYRAAELTVQTGHDWFQVVDRNTVQEYSGYGGSPTFGLSVGSRSESDPDAYDAFSVISRLQPKVLTGGS